MSNKSITTTLDRVLTKDNTQLENGYIPVVPLDIASKGYVDNFASSVMYEVDMNGTTEWDNLGLAMTDIMNSGATSFYILLHAGDHILSGETESGFFDSYWIRNKTILIEYVDPATTVTLTTGFDMLNVYLQTSVEFIIATTGRMRMYRNSFWHVDRSITVNKTIEMYNSCVLFLDGKGFDVTSGADTIVEANDNCKILSGGSQDYIWINAGTTPTTKIMFELHNSSYESVLDTEKMMGTLNINGFDTMVNIISKSQVYLYPAHLEAVTDIVLVDGLNYPGSGFHYDSTTFLGVGGSITPMPFMFNGTLAGDIIAWDKAYPMGDEPVVLDTDLDGKIYVRKDRAWVEVTHPSQAYGWVEYGLYSGTAVNLQSAPTGKYYVEAFDTVNTVAVQGVFEFHSGKGTTTPLGVRSGAAEMEIYQAEIINGYLYVKLYSGGYSTGTTINVNALDLWQVLP